MNLTIEQYCQLETLKTDLRSCNGEGCQYREKIENNVTILEVTDSEGNLVKELIIVL